MKIVWYNQQRKANRPRFNNDNLVAKGTFKGTFIQPEGLPILTDAQHNNIIAMIISARRGMHPTDAANAKGAS
eukprot:12885965-Prorocentrum_lima.AAC.1